MQDFRVRTEYFVLSCYTLKDGAFYCEMLSLIYLVVLQIVGIILAFKTRNVKLGILNEAKYVAAFIGIVASIIHIPVTFMTANFVLTSYINVTGGIFSGSILLLATMSLAFTFIPKVCQ